VGHVARTGSRRDAYRVLVGKPEGKRSLAITRRRWNVNIIVVFTERAWEGEDGIDLAQNHISLGANFPHPSRPALRPTQPPLKWVPCLPRGQSGRGVKLTNLHLAPRLRKE
jgi:hypothetical protein